MSSSKAHVKEYQGSWLEQCYEVRSLTHPDELVSNDTEGVTELLERMQAIRDQVCDTLLFLFANNTSGLLQGLKNRIEGILQKKDIDCGDQYRKFCASKLMEISPTEWTLLGDIGVMLAALDDLETLLEDLVETARAIKEDPKEKMTSDRLLSLITGRRTIKVRRREA